MATETSRVEAFSDGVFAIAMTLLVLEIKVPPPAAHLAGALLQQWPAYFAFLLSFLFIGIMWINHHRLFSHIRRSTDALLFLNLMLLLGITFLPFPTAVLAVHLNDEGMRAAAVFFNGTFVVIAVLFNALWGYVVRAELFGADVDYEHVRAITRQYAVGPVAYAACLLLTWVSVTASLGMQLLLAIFFAIPPRHAIGPAQHRSARR